MSSILDVISNCQSRNISVNDIQSDSIKLRDIDDDQVRDMSSNIYKNGVLQPILVRPFGKSYKIIYGEHRLAATKLAGLEEIPCFVIDVTDLESIELKLSENIQRNIKLKPDVEGELFLKLINEKYVSDAKLARAIGKPLSYIRERVAIYKNLDSSLKEKVGSSLTIAQAKALSTHEPEEQKTIYHNIEVRKNQHKILTESEEEMRGHSVRNVSRYRDGLQIVYEMLVYIQQEPRSKTHIMYANNLSYQQMAEKLVFCEKNKFLLFDKVSVKYSITERGGEFVSRFSSVMELIDNGQVS